MLTGNHLEVGVSTASHDAKTLGAAAIGGGAGAIIGALVGGPVGAVIGGMIGADDGVAEAVSPPHVQNYIIDNPAPRVYLNGEVVLGAGVPAEVYSVPDYTAQYATINGHAVLIDPATRQIVEIIRYRSKGDPPGR